MTNIFEQVRQKWQGSPYIIFVFVLALFIFCAGVWLFIEDGKSSRDGFEALEAAFGVEFGNWPMTYWIIGFIPQVAQIFFMYLFMMDSKKNYWALAVVALFFSIDLVSDVQDRSGQQLFPLSNFSFPAVAIASGYTVTFITIGSELFISAAIGVLLATWPHALAQFGIQRNTYREASGGRIRQRRSSVN
jgi:hypothetical protein